MWLPAPTGCPGCTGGWRGCIADCASTGGTGSEGRSDSDGVCEVGGAGSPPSAIPISRCAAGARTRARKPRRVRHTHALRLCERHGGEAKCGLSAGRRLCLRARVPCITPVEMRT